MQLILTLLQGHAIVDDDSWNFFREVFFMYHLDKFCGKLKVVSVLLNLYVISESLNTERGTERCFNMIWNGRLGEFVFRS